MECIKGPGRHPKGGGSDPAPDTGFLFCVGVGAAGGTYPHSLDHVHNEKEPCSV